MTMYVVNTDLPPDELNRLGLEIYAKWRDFALGKTALPNGKRLIAPAGRYAASLQYKREGEAAVAIIADEAIAPEARWLEEGHGAVDLKTILQHGKPYAMHGTGIKASSRPKAGPPGKMMAMWVQTRSSRFSGFASIGPNSDPDSWIIPAMAAYSPARTFAAMASAMARRMGT